MRTIHVQSRGTGKQGQGVATTMIGFASIWWRTRRMLLAIISIQN